MHILPIITSSAVYNLHWAFVGSCVLSQTTEVTPVHQATKQIGEANKITQSLINSLSLGGERCVSARELVGSNHQREHSQVESMNGKEGNLASVAVGRPSRSAERRREKDARITGEG
jgi:hypothetical protein